MKTIKIYTLQVQGTSYAPGPGVVGLGSLNLSSLEHSRLSLPNDADCSGVYSPGPVRIQL